MEREVNNAFYDTLGASWYEAQDHPVALLRSENRLRAPWIVDQLRSRRDGRCNILDLGCGGGFLSNQLVAAGHRVCGVDISQSSLQIARRFDQKDGTRYARGDLYSLPFPDCRFDVACAMDVLEHVEHPERLVAEAARVLRPGGLFFFYTLNRNLLSWLIVIKGVEWFVDNVPPDMHIYRYLITPDEMSTMCGRCGLRAELWAGVRPRMNRAFWSLLTTGRVRDEFEFCFTRHRTIAYCGIAIKSSTN